MSGRYTFTAGNTLTAAQMNTNVMDGIPYKMIAGTTPSITGSLAITFPVSFTTGITPNITLGLISSTNTGTSATITTANNTGFTCAVWVGSAVATGAKNVFYTAIQMTPTSGSGNS